MGRTTSSHWGAGQVEISGGELKGVHPYPGDPDPSRINENMVGAFTGSARIRRPAVRKSYLENGPLSADSRRGEELFVEVSWDTVLDLITAEMNRVRGQFGNKAIYGGSYGWASAGRFHHAQSQLKRFLNCAGGFVRSKGNYSYNAALDLYPHIVGDFNDQIRHATRFSTVAKEGELVVAFGGIPLRSAQVGAGGTVRHRLSGDLARCKESGVSFVAFSPFRDDVMEALDAEHLMSRPHSDSAIMMGLAHTIIAEERHDQAFLNQYTVGFEKVKAYLFGEVDGVVKDAAWAAEMSGLSATRLKSLAREMASKRTLITMAVSLQRAEYGEQPIWMTVTLAALLGQIGLPGGGFGLGYGSDACIGTADRPFQWPSLSQKSRKLDAYIPVACVSDMLLHPGETYEYDGQIRTYPDIRMVWWAGGNPFHHHQDLNRLRKAFQKPETIIVNEFGWTATARHADIVLPVATTLEREDIGAGSQDTALIPMPRVMQPVAESRTEYAIFADLSKRLGFEADFTEGRTERQWLEKLWGQMQSRAKKFTQRELPNFEEFLAGDVIDFADPTPDRVYLSAFRADPEAHPLTTPSGKIELFSEVIDGFGYEDCPGHASWLSPKEWLGSDVADRFPLHLISGQPATRLHSQLDSGAFSRARKIKGREPVLIHPTNASKRGIESGDVVRLFNDRGSCLAGAVVTEDVREDVIFLWTGAWYDPDFSTPDHMDRHGNPNALTHDRRTSRLSQGPASQSALVEVEKFEGALPEVQAFIPPIATEK